MSLDAYLTEREGFEPSWEHKLPIRFRVGAVMTASVPLHLSNYNPGGTSLTSFAASGYCRSDTG